MKTGWNRLSRILVVLFALLSIGTIIVAATRYFQGRVSCESNDNRRRTCRIDTRGGVRLARQLSDSPCIQGRTWGYDRNAVWVSNGCRAEFEVGRGGDDRFGGNRGGDRGGRFGSGQTISCESNDNRRNLCQVDTRGGVRLVRQRSDSPCVQGRTWGYNRNAIWVTNGCRADFEVGRR